ncbi:hypothetical protein F383_14744 [Gossypium arboreum]|uniref:Uncharacterized protein n=1 Tax=Gossypium arboreum TaxID=29729 RepID=A0A0B0Q1B5_GOSAR|nr:hypothetical protein F383_14744 [Gossypium arboreum]
MTFVGPSLA